MAKIEKYAGAEEDTPGTKVSKQGREMARRKEANVILDLTGKHQG